MIPTMVLAGAGGIGALTRFVVDAAIARRSTIRVPVGTLVINVSGSLLLGLLTGLAAAAAPASTAAGLKAALGTGFCGGYTTFSTASVETVRLWVAEGRATGSGYAAATMVGSVAAAGLGLGLGHLIAAMTT